MRVKKRKKNNRVIVLTGTPGTGKSSAAQELHHCHFDVIRVNDFVKKNDTLESISGKVKKAIKGKEKTIVEGHFAHLLGIKGICVVLRTHPEVLRRRLEEKKFSARKITENLEAEALDVCLIESTQRYKRVYEIDTTQLTPEETAEKIKKINSKRKNYSAGRIDWSEDFFV